MPALSIVLLNWNGAHLLPACLDSLRAQTFQDYEIIVPDNGSTDGSLELLAARYPEAEVIRLPRNLGFSLAMNAGIRASRGRFVLSLNNDTELDPRCLEELAAAMCADDRVGMCAPKMVYHDDPTLINSAGHACTADGWVYDIGRGQPDGAWFDQPREIFGACAGAALYRRAMLEEVGLFDPDFFISYEDADLNWRAQFAGWRARYVPTARVRHREGVSRQIYSRRAVFLGLRNLIHVWTKDWPLRELLPTVPIMVARLRASLLAVVERDGLGLAAAVVGSALWQTPRMLNRRRRIQRARRAPRERFAELLAMGERHTAQPPED